MYAYSHSFLLVLLLRSHAIKTYFGQEYPLQQRSHYLYDFSFQLCTILSQDMVQYIEEFSYYLSCEQCFLFRFLLPNKPHRRMSGKYHKFKNMISRFISFLQTAKLYIVISILIASMKDYS